MTLTYSIKDQHRFPTAEQALSSAEAYHAAVVEMMKVCPDAKWSVLPNGTEGWLSHTVEPTDVTIMISDRIPGELYLCTYRNVFGTRVFNARTLYNNPDRLFLAFKLAREANYKSLVALATELKGPL